MSQVAASPRHSGRQRSTVARRASGRRASACAPAQMAPSSPMRYAKDVTLNSELLRAHAVKLRKALGRLRTSLLKVAPLDTNVEKLNDADLESWESFTARFGRATDLFVARFLRTWVLEREPGFRGFLRDYLDQAEKGGLIDSAQNWVEIRELRNSSAHEYADEELSRILAAIRDHAPRVLALEATLDASDRA